LTCQFGKGQLTRRTVHTEEGRKNVKGKKTTEKSFRKKEPFEERSFLFRKKIGKP